MSTICEQSRFQDRFKVDIKNYKIVTNIKKGGFGSVLLVQEINTNEQYAAKIIDQDQGMDRDQNKKMINREIGIMMRIQHPTIIKLIGYSFQDPYGFDNVTLILQLAKKGSLSEILKKAQNGLADPNYDNTARQIILVGIARGMMLLHQKNIIHRDLKPDNVLLDDNLYPLITDFGLSKIYDSNNSSKQSQSCGTSYYMAPEVISSNRYNGKADVYSFGILMFEVLTETDPYPSKLTPFQLTHKVVYENLRPTFTVPIKKSFQTLIERCWSVDPNERPTFEELFNKLAFNIEDSIYDIYDGEEHEKIEEQDKYFLDDVDVDALNYYLDEINMNDSNQSQKIAEIDELLKKLESLQNQILPLVNENQEMKAQITNLTKSNENMQAQIDDLTGKNFNLETQVSQLILKNSSLNKKVSKLSGKLDKFLPKPKISVTAAEFDTFDVKVTILGTGEVGKSSIFRQFKILLYGGYSKSELQDFSEVIKINLISDIKTLAEAMESSELKIPENLSKCAKVFDECSLDAECLTQEFASNVVKFWQSSKVKEFYSKKYNVLGLSDNAPYFLDNAQKISEKGYIPTEEDLIKSRIRTSGISSIHFRIDDRINTEIIDVGGQKCERGKWQRCFQNVSFLFFVVSLSDFNQYMFEDDSVKKTSDSLELFSNTINSPVFNTKPIFLIFNKEDIFERKLREDPDEFRRTYPKFKGDIRNVDECIEHIKDCYLQLANRKKEDAWIETVVTCALDAKSIRNLLQVMVNKIAETNEEKELSIIQMKNADEQIKVTDEQKKEKKPSGSHKKKLFGKK